MTVVTRRCPPPSFVPSHVGVPHAAHFQIGGIRIVFVMPGADTRPGRARAGIFLVEGVLTPIVKLQRIAAVQRFRIVFVAFRVSAAEQPPRGVEPRCAGSEYGICFASSFSASFFAEPLHLSGKIFFGNDNFNQRGLILQIL